ncbi:hypothetical protein [Scandinavium manionii]|uniref:hypothetical protein n=1 Tax=Scandinavium manionii TaxID=2926520 RepID=UPI00216673E4|nr:hypothetical protein [Scandinavium manionii]MCS2147119.1 hypothetical protein [Scandinavium manionii]
MRLNKKNIERCKSLEIGFSNDGHEMKMRVDKLSIVLDVMSETEQYDYLSRKFMIMPKSTWRKYKVGSIKRTRPNNPYKMFFTISKGSNMLAHISFKPSRKNTGAIRLDLRPQYMTGKGMDNFINWLNQRLNGRLIPLLGTAWVTQVDVALDLYGCKLKDYIWGARGVSEYNSYNTVDGLPGIRLGSLRSPRHMGVYEKVDINGSGLHFNDDSEFLDIDIDKYPSFLRIEARVRPCAKPGSKRKKALMLKKLDLMPNPFEYLQVYSTKLEAHLNVYKSIWNKPKNNTIKAYKEFTLGGVKKQRISRKIESIIKKHEVQLFDRDEIWEWWGECVKRLGVLVEK